MKLSTFAEAVSYTTCRIQTLLLDAIGNPTGTRAPCGLPAGATHLNDLRLILAGTPCEGGLFDQEIRAAAAETGSDVLLVRHGLFPETLNPVTFDVVLHLDVGILPMRSFDLYHGKEEGFWLIPQERGPFVALEPGGLRLSFQPPFLTGHYCEEGLKKAARLIIKAVRPGLGG